jgi:hypothetical protein
VSILMKLCRTQLAFTHLNSPRMQSQMALVTQLCSALHGNCRQLFCVISSYKVYVGIWKIMSLLDLHHQVIVDYYSIISLITNHG